MDKAKEKIAIKTSYFSIASNLLLAIIKGLAGVYGNSHALVADAVESTTDVFSSFLVLLGLRYAKKPADKNHPYGHGRIEPLITFIIVAFLIGSAVFIIYNSIQNLQNPHGLPESWTLYILGAIILWKEISFRFISKRSKETNSSSLKADAWHHRSDSITSIAAFLGISIALYFGEAYQTADDWAALVAAGIILYNSYKIFRPALGEIMDEHTFDTLILKIRTVANTVDGVVHTEKCFVRKAGLEYHVELHAWVNGAISVRQGHAIAHQLKDTLKKELPELGHVLIHIEPNQEDAKQN